MVLNKNTSFPLYYNKDIVFLIMHKVANAGIARGVLDTSTEMDVVMPGASARNGAITHK